jgi:putative ribosome biogenesis GTPase RsgA
MGQSGAGKSSFVSILTARTTSRTTGFSLQGNVFMNG